MKFSLQKNIKQNKINKSFIGLLTKKNFSSNFKIDPKFVEEYNKNGYAHIKGVFSSDQIEEIKAEAQDIIKKSDVSELKSKFDTNHRNDDKYFIESGDKIRFFLEQNAFNEEGKLVHPIKESINKIGHGINLRFFFKIFFVFLFFFILFCFVFFLFLFKF